MIMILNMKFIVENIIIIHKNLSQFLNFFIIHLQYIIKKIIYFIIIIKKFISFFLFNDN